MPSWSGPAGLVTLLTSGSVWWKAVLNPLPVVRVNDDDLLLSVWDSESYGAPANARPECKGWNQSVAFRSTLCSHFSISRFARSSPSRAIARALTCAAEWETECVLSPEIGLSIPAAFIYSHKDGGMNMIVAPNLLEFESQQQHVRSTPPAGDLLSSATFLMNRTVRAEFLSGETRTMHSEIFEGETAYCLQLLRMAFEPNCWEALD
jgi:hypothetical protein